MEAEARAQGVQKPTQAGSRKRDAYCWQNPALWDRLQRLWAERDEHDETLKLDSVLCEQALQMLDTAKEGDAPQSVVSDQGTQVLAAIDPEAPLLVDNGIVAGGFKLDPWHDDNAESCMSGFTGSSCRSEVSGS
jgi:hypothetical protein